jgi:hypothetical protein
MEQFLSVSIQDYLKNIYELTENGKAPRRTRWQRDFM